MSFRYTVVRPAIAVTASVLALCFILSHSLLALGAASVHLRGRIVHDSTKAALRNVRVLARHLPDSSLIRGSLSDAKGDFDLEISGNQKIVLEITRLGLSSVRRTLELRSDDISLGTIALRDSVMTTSEVEVQGWRQFTEIKADKKVYTINDNPNIVGANTVSQVLDQIPALNVDEKGLVYLRGTQRVSVMVNGRELKMDDEALGQYLQSLTADNIQAIEVKNTNGVTDDARQSGGSINIITKKSHLDRLGGTVNANITDNGGMRAGGTMYYSDSSLSASLGLGTHKNISHTNAQFARVEPALGTLPSITKTIIEDATLPGYHIEPQIDWNMSKSDVLSFSTTYSINPKCHWESLGNGARYNPQGDSTQVIRDSSHSNRDYSWTDASAFYRHTFSENHEIKLTVGYTRWTNHRDEYKSGVVYTGQEIDRVQSLRAWLLGDDEDPAWTEKLDYKVDLNPTWSMQAGQKIEIERRPSDIAATRYDFVQGINVVDTAQTLKLNPIMKVFAFYGNLHFNVSADLQVQAGLRVELPTQGADFASGRIERSYPNVFPNVSCEWTLSDVYSLNFSYSKSIGLPDISLLNPRVNRETATSVSLGNPDIRPEITHYEEVALNASWKATTFTATQFFSRNIDEIQYSGYLENDILHSTWANFNGAWNLGLILNLTHRTKGGLSANASLVLQDLHNLGGSVGSDIATDSYSARANLSLSYELMHNWTASGSVRYASPYRYGGDHSFDRTNSNLSSTLKLFEDALFCTLSLSDPFDVLRTKRSTTGLGYILDMNSKSNSKLWSLTLSYNFGSRKPKLIEHSNEKEETKGGA